MVVAPFGMLILIVDDEPWPRRATARFVRSLGHRTIEADGQEALEQLRADGPIDLVISDYDMPDVSGADVLAAAQQAHVPLVFHTGNAAAAARFGVAVIAKGSGPEKLAEMVTAHARKD